MPPPWPSASASASASAIATRFATHWIADGLAGDESLEFALLQALVRTSSEPLAGAPEATRERVALRSLQEVSSVIAAGGDTAAASAVGVLRVDGARSREDVLLRLVREVESSGKLETDLLPPFSQDIQEAICTKKFTLPETSFQLLKGVNPWITSMTPQSQLEHNGTEQCDNDQSLRSSHKCVNAEKPVFPTDNAEVQQETMANLVNESETGNLQKDPSAPTAVLHQPCTPKSRPYVPPQEDTIDAAGLGARSPERSPIVEGNMSVESVLASAGCDAPLQGSITEPFSQQDKHDHTATVEPKSCRQISPNLPHCASGEGADDGGSSNQSYKVSSHEGPSAHATVTPDFDRISDVLPTDASERVPECITTQDTTMSSQPDSRKAHLSVLQHERGEKVNQDQGSKSETNLQPGTATEDRVAFEEQNADKSHIEVSGANKANQALHDDDSIMKNNTVHGGLTAQTAPVTQNCNATLHDKTSEDNCFSEQENEKNRTDVQKDNLCTFVPSSSNDTDGESAKKTSNQEKSKDTPPQIYVRSKDQCIDDTLEDSSQEDLCIKCRNGGQLLKCSACFLVAHDSCFGSSVTDPFYCPLCFYMKAKEAYENSKATYREARKNFVAFFGKEDDEQLTGVQRGAAKRDGHMSKRNSIHQNEAYDLADQDEDPHQQRKKQKINARGNGCPKEVLTEKIPFQNSGPASMNRHSVLQNNSKTQVEDLDKKQQAGDKEARKEAGNDKSSYGKRASSQRRCDPPNRGSEVHQEDSRTASNQSGGCDELEATSFNDSGKRPSPPWLNMRQSKKRSQEKKSAAPRKRKSVHPQKRYSNPLAPAGRRRKLPWSAAEVDMLREAMEKFTPQGDEQIPWIQIREYGSGVFQKTRLPDDLRVKWRSLRKGSYILNITNHPCISFEPICKSAAVHMEH